MFKIGSQSTKGEINMEDKELILITEKNKHLQDWRYVNMYPYNERWALQEEIRKFTKEIQ